MILPSDICKLPESSERRPLKDGEAAGWGLSKFALTTVVVLSYNTRLVKVLHTNRCTF